MKQIYFLALLVFYSPFSFSQERAQEYKWGMTLMLNMPDRFTPLMNLNYGIDNTWFDSGDRRNKSFAADMIINYFSNSDRSLRIKIGLSNNHFSEHREVMALNNSIEDIDYKQRIANFIPGLCWKMRQNKTIVYGGMEIPFLIYDKLRSEYSYFKQDSATSSILEQSFASGRADGGFAVGPGVFSGFNFYAHKRVLVGGELSFALLYRKVGGDIYGSYVQTVPLNSTMTTVTHQTIIDLGMTRLIGGISIAYLF